VKSSVHTILADDNTDKTVKPRDMRTDGHTRFLHYFQAYVVRSRIDVTHMGDQPFFPSLESTDVATILPTKKTMKTLSVCM